MGSTIDNVEISEVTIDGEEVQEITVDGEVVFEAGEPTELIAGTMEEGFFGKYLK